MLPAVTRVVSPPLSKSDAGYKRNDELRRSCLVSSAGGNLDALAEKQAD